MTLKMEKKTVAIIIGVIIFLLLAIFFGLHLLGPLLDPVTRDMMKIFFCGVGCGLLPGIWLGIKIHRHFSDDEKKLKADEAILKKEGL